MKTVEIKISKEASRYSSSKGYAVTFAQVKELMEQVMVAHGMTVGQQLLEFNGHFNIEFRRAFGTSCQLRYDNDIDYKEMEKLDELNPEINGHIAPNKPEIELGWSATGRDIVHSLSAINLYKQVVDMAADFQDRLTDAASYIIYPKA